MTKIKLYEIPIEDVVLYHNIVGFYDISDDISKIKTTVAKFKELSPIPKKNTLPKNTYNIDLEIRHFLERLYTEFDDNLSDIVEQHNYKIAYLGILGQTLNLNLIKDDNLKDHFERLNTIINIVLSSLNNMDIEDVIKLYEAIKKCDKNEIEKYQPKKCKLTLLILLSMIDEDINDYEMFITNDEIDIDTLYKLVKTEKQIVRVNKTYKLRPSFKICQNN